MIKKVLVLGSVVLAGCTNSFPENASPPPVSIPGLIALQSVGYESGMVCLHAAKSMAEGQEEVAKGLIDIVRDRGDISDLECRQWIEQGYAEWANYQKHLSQEANQHNYKYNQPTGSPLVDGFMQGWNMMNH
ncbi:hypothetical protein [Photobacterium damselae]|uniref:hypothetical protein n=1 Tax=Photobacterium damselae TaxID=38293 RepID=UPI001F1DF589|nr:hypothetical protein [Photobacterium damselae]UKA12916.1 hypothetical protein IHC91_21600 [Photobacterium damselae subsp. damselae]